RWTNSCAMGKEPTSARARDPTAAAVPTNPANLAFAREDERRVDRPRRAGAESPRSPRRSRRERSIDRERVLGHSIRGEPLERHGPASLSHLPPPIDVENERFARVANARRVVRSAEEPAS